MISSEPIIRVGILERQREIRGCFKSEFTLAGGLRVRGEFVANSEVSVTLISHDGKVIQEHSAIVCVPATGGVFELQNVTIGLRFHWERKEHQAFNGSLRIVRDNEGLTAINEIGLEEYLKSVISSEMSAESPLELLRAHAITSRSWLAAMLLRQREERNLGGASRGLVSDEEVIRWYDREDHALFDVCADDHCQRYQGVTKIISDATAEAVESTRGICLVHNDEICDARFYKACGGRTDVFESAWEDKYIPYLQSVSDGPEECPVVGTEQEAERWILGRPSAYCRTDDANLLRTILPSFDLETADFFRWKVEYEGRKLAEIIGKKSGIDFGTIRDLIPLKRGPSGRIVRLKVVGSDRTMIVGKELEIRRWLSPSHLYSSAFVVRTARDPSGVPTRFILNGAGWGHGVGLCQIGAAVMATRGERAEGIVRHYFRNTALKKLY